jgi:hypothetical protein
MQKQLRPRQTRSKKLKTNSFSEWIKVFNKKHNSHLNTSIGVVNVKTKNYDK